MNAMAGPSMVAALLRFMSETATIAAIPTLELVHRQLSFIQRRADDRLGRMRTGFFSPQIYSSSLLPVVIVQGQPSRFRGFSSL